MNTKHRYCGFLLFLFCIPFLSAQEKSPGLSLEDIFVKGTIEQKGYGPIHWMKDSKSYFTFEDDLDAGGRDIILYDVSTGKRSIYASAKLFIPQGTLKPLKVSSVQWSEDNNQLLIFTNTRRVWRYNTKGDYWILNLKSGKLSQLGKTLPVASLMFAKFSPDGSRVAFVSEQNIFVEDLIDGRILKLTNDGGSNIINGIFDWVYEEELDCRDGFRWSPDGKFIAYWQSDTRGTGVFNIINNLDSIYPKIIPFPYPKVGTLNSAVKIGFVVSTGGTTHWLPIPGDPRNNYLARMDFIPNSNELIIQQLNRLQNKNFIWICKLENESIENIFTETDKAFLDIHDNIKWLDHEKYFTWTSERDGWLHLYKLSRDGKDLKLITNGNMDVTDINCIDENGGYVYYTSSPENYTQRYLFRSKLNGKGEPERITPLDKPGLNFYQVSPDAKWAIHSFQNTSQPELYELVDLPKHKVLRVLEDNAEVRQQYEKLGFNKKEFFKVDIGEIVLDGWMIKPAGFDPTKKYPVIFHVYGEPAASTVLDSWDGNDLWHQYLAQKGYIIMSVDNRGTNVPRGREWRKSIYRQIGILAAEDQAKAALKISSIFPFVDAERIGIWGWSGGGSMTLDCMFRHPEIYKTGIAVAFVADQRLYDNIYQERYMGLPDDNPEGYRDGSPINHAGNLKGNLLLVHGSGDDNVHYQNFERLVNELVKQNKLFSMMVYPMRSHGIYERENTSYHLRETFEKFWLQNLPPGGR